ncbi:hypothetical protein [Rhodopseudomonas palustris]|uniref:CopG family transcriptional regulator n=1 Tax=Rhodopseudomonas palustris TaxID=1076 RepID=A0A418VF32_RHOPL|nr:hypothetical protein [Rhodopseudomonas palustris]RJF74734.1 hypothetical protein D4Q52_11465 [Rhodopseudomonas palustris]
MVDITVHLDDELFDKAARVARLDSVSVQQLVETAVKRHLDYVETLNDVARTAPLTLTDYDLVRDPDEGDAEFAARRSLFE